MNFRSYLGKVFVVESSKAIIRDEQFREKRYQTGDVIPPGKNVGDVKIIPQRTEVKVTDVRADADRHAYAFCVAADSGESFGWTSAMNLVGSLANETAGLAPASWALEPQGANMTCVDNNALVRDGAPAFASRGTTIPARTFVAVTEKSADGSFVKVSQITIAQSGMQMGLPGGAGQVEQDRPHQADLSACRLRQGGHDQAEAAGNGEQAADDHLLELVGLLPLEAPPFPEGGDRDQHREAEPRVERDQPAGRERGSGERQLEMLVAPDEIGVEDFLVGQQRNAENGDEDDQRDHPAPLFTVEFLARSGG